MVKVTLKQKMVCPYCKAKQEYKAKDYFSSSCPISQDLQCDGCDQLFNAEVVRGEVYSFSNLISILTTAPTSVK